MQLTLFKLHTPAPTIGRYFGGKALPPVRRWIVANGPRRCSAYVEAFGGLFSTGLARERSLIEIYNEINPSTRNLIAAIRDDVGPLVERLNATQWSRELYEECRHRLEQGPDAYSAMIQCCLSHIGGGVDPSSPIGTSDNRIARYAYDTMVDCTLGYMGGGCDRRKHGGTSAGQIAEVGSRRFDYLYEVSARLQGVQILGEDAIALIRSITNPTTFIYVDPPYVPDQRVGGKYAYDFTLDQHIALLEAIRQSSAMVMVSNYDNGLYNESLQGWRTDTRSTQSSGRHRRIEKIWMNYGN